MEISEDEVVHAAPLQLFQRNLHSGRFDAVEQLRMRLAPASSELLSSISSCQSYYVAALKAARQQRRHRRGGAGGGGAGGEDDENDDPDGFTFDDYGDDDDDAIEEHHDDHDADHAAHDSGDDASGTPAVPSSLEPRILAAHWDSAAADELNAAYLTLMKRHVPVIIMAPLSSEESSAFLAWLLRRAPRLCILTPDMHAALTAHRCAGNPAFLSSVLRGLQFTLDTESIEELQAAAEDAAAAERLAEEVKRDPLVDTSRVSFSAAFSRPHLRASMVRMGSTLSILSDDTAEGSGLLSPTAAHAGRSGDSAAALPPVVTEEQRSCWQKLLTRPLHALLRSKDMFTLMRALLALAERRWKLLFPDRAFCPLRHALALVYTSFSGLPMQEIVQALADGNHRTAGGRSGSLTSSLGGTGGGRAGTAGDQLADRPVQLTTAQQAFLKAALLLFARPFGTELLMRAVQRVCRRVIWARCVKSHGKRLALHAQLARFFQRQPASGRQLAEVLWHLEKSETWRVLLKRLTDVPTFRSMWSSALTRESLKRLWRLVQDNILRRGTAAACLSGEGDEGLVVDMVEEYNKQLEHWVLAHKPSASELGCACAEIAAFLRSFEASHRSLRNPQPQFFHPPFSAKDASLLGVPPLSSIVPDEPQQDARFPFYRRWVWLQFPWLALAGRRRAAAAVAAATAAAATVTPPPPTPAGPAAAGASPKAAASASAAASAAAGRHASEGDGASKPAAAAAGAATGSGATAGAADAADATAGESPVAAATGGTDGKSAVPTVTVSPIRSAHARHHKRKRKKKGSQFRSRSTEPRRSHAGLRRDAASLAPRSASSMSSRHGGRRRSRRHDGGTHGSGAALPSLSTTWKTTLGRSGETTARSRRSVGIGGASESKKRLPTLRLGGGSSTVMDFKLAERYEHKVEAMRADIIAMKSEFNRLCSRRKQLSAELKKMKKATKLNNSEARVTGELRSKLADMESKLAELQRRNSNLLEAKRLLSHTLGLATKWPGRSDLVVRSIEKKITREEAAIEKERQKLHDLQFEARATAEELPRMVAALEEARAVHNDVLQRMQRQRVEMRREEAEEEATAERRRAIVQSVVDERAEKEHAELHMKDVSVSLLRERTHRAAADIAKDLRRWEARLKRLRDHTGISSLDVMAEKIESESQLQEYLHEAISLAKEKVALLQRQKRTLLVTRSKLRKLHHHRGRDATQRHIAFTEKALAEARAKLRAAKEKHDSVFTLAESTRQGFYQLSDSMCVDNVRGRELPIVLADLLNGYDLLLDSLSGRAGVLSASLSKVATRKLPASSPDASASDPLLTASHAARAAPSTAPAAAVAAAAARAATAVAGSPASAGAAGAVGPEALGPLPIKLPMSAKRSRRRSVIGRRTSVDLSAVSRRFKLTHMPAVTLAAPMKLAEQERERVDADVVEADTADLDKEFRARRDMIRHPIASRSRRMNRRGGSKRTTILRGASASSTASLLGAIAEMASATGGDSKPAVSPRSHTSAASGTSSSSTSMLLPPGFTGGASEQVKPAAAATGPKLPSLKGPPLRRGGAGSPKAATLPASGSRMRLLFSH
eukprot:PLAT3690.5.p1 GENE.PLAT3690.5~~PLAT3690.5.p1  ORF type:complete len:1578 (+),score=780.68 PLAT3690.5:57-4790(+)